MFDRQAAQCDREVAVRDLGEVCDVAKLGATLVQRLQFRFTRLADAIVASLGVRVLDLDLTDRFHELRDASPVEASLLLDRARLVDVTAPSTDGEVVPSRSRVVLATHALGVEPNAHTGAVDDYVATMRIRAVSAFERDLLRRVERSELLE